MHKVRGPVCSFVEKRGGVESEEKEIGERQDNDEGE